MKKKSPTRPAVFGFSPVRFFKSLTSRTTSHHLLDIFQIPSKYRVVPSFF
ncbi:hypothetical protein KFK09_005381 [Dendrobium nobile]|uniref:Uncharacterized protein n=1 Tax=Dendrobium nobile TaxID=94219 RepID=A0A8T3BY49_DENNO|nr:hypothetical protein KFK09_005381 [Dendrobium nobile]